MVYGTTKFQRWFRWDEKLEKYMKIRRPREYQKVIAIGIG
jgi:hypothetical protein